MPDVFLVVANYYNFFFAWSALFRLDIDGGDTLSCIYRPKVYTIVAIHSAPVPKQSSSI